MIWRSLTWTARRCVCPGSPRMVASPRTASSTQAQRQENVSGPQLQAGMITTCFSSSWDLEPNTSSEWLPRWTEVPPQSWRERTQPVRHLRNKKNRLSLIHLTVGWQQGTGISHRLYTLRWCRICILELFNCTFFCRITLHTHNIHSYNNF